MRPFGIAHIIDGKLCVMTGKCKPISKQIVSLEMLHSLYLWLDGQKEAAFAALDKARGNGLKLIQVCEDGVAHYTAPLVRLAEEKVVCSTDIASQDYGTVAEDWPWWTVPEKSPGYHICFLWLKGRQQNTSGCCGFVRAETTAS